MENKAWYFGRKPKILSRICFAWGKADAAGLLGNLAKPIKNPAMDGEVCCFGKEFDSEFNTLLTALKLPCVARSLALNPSHTITQDTSVLHGQNRCISSLKSGFGFCQTRIGFSKTRSRFCQTGNWVSWFGRINLRPFRQRCAVFGCAKKPTRSKSGMAGFASYFHCQESLLTISRFFLKNSMFLSSFALGSSLTNGSPSIKAPQFSPKVIDV